MATIYVIMWNYHDGSDFGIIDRASYNEDEVRWLIKTLLSSDTGKAYSIWTVGLEGRLIEVPFEELKALPSLSGIPTMYAVWPTPLDPHAAEG